MHTLLLVSGDDIDEQMLPFSADYLLPPYEDWLSYDEIARMAQAYDVTQDNLQALAEKMPDWTGDQGFVREGHLGRVSRRNPNAKFDSYEIGGRYAGYLHLTEAKAPTRLSRVIGKPAVHNVNHALKGEVDVAKIENNPPGALLHAGTWIEAPYGNFCETDWKKQFLSLFREIPDDFKLTVVDKHL